MTYKLEKYRSRANRYQCPQCGDKHSFTRYVCTETGEYVHSSVGRCDHVQSCGYHYTPRDFYHDNPWETEGSTSPSRISERQKSRKQQKPSKPDPVYIPSSIPAKYQGNAPDNFILWLSSHFSPTAVQLACSAYRLGTTSPTRYKQQGIIFWQIDRFGQVHDGKIMWYRTDGHREKYMTWVSSKLKKVGLFPDQDTDKCLFGEHLLETPEYCDLPVCIVESEKSAIVLSCLYPDVTWLASCGCGGLNRQKLRCLRGRMVSVVPDAGEYDRWLEILSSAGIDFQLYSLDNYPANTDIVDILFDNIKPVNGDEISINNIINQIKKSQL